MNIEITSPREKDRDALRKLWQEAFGDGEEFLDLFERTAYSPSRARALFCDGTLSAALYWFDCEFQGEKIAYLYAIATAKKERGKGLCRRLMENTHEHLKKLGYAAAMLVPSGDSLFGFYEKLGYHTATQLTEFSCLAEGEPIKLVKIDREEYAKLRRKMLPEGGVVQERENLTYLAAQAEFSRGEDFLLAARQEAEKLIGMELLGNLEVAPRIVQTLEKKEGSFRTVGHGRDFSMICVLTSKKTIDPTYFGLAFD